MKINKIINVYCLKSENIAQAETFCYPMLKKSENYIRRC